MIQFYDGLSFFRKKMDKWGGNLCKTGFLGLRKHLPEIHSGIIPGIFFFVFSAFFHFQATGQTANEAEWNGNGYSLKKIVSNTTIPSGVNFSYTIMFSAPAGATNIFIEDEVPGALDIVSVPTPSAVNGVTPTVNISGQTVTYSLSGLPAGSASSGSFTIVVKFPEGVTCDGTAARNRAGIRINDKMNYTPYVSTTATAENPWEITKSIISGPVVNPNGGNCGYVMAEGDTVTYRLAVVKKSPFYGNVTGQHNMSNAVVNDVLPPGAVFLSSSCGVSPPLSGNTFTWSPNGGLLDAATPWAYYSCDITVYYPAGPFPNGTPINNEATLDGDMCNQQVSHTSNETCIEVGQVTIDTDAFFRKYIYMTNRVPGCNGFYRIAFKNTGNTSLSAFNIDDVIPSGVSVNSVRVFGGSPTTEMALTANSGSDIIASSITSNFFNSGNLGYPVNDLQLSMVGSLPAGNWINMYIYFTVEPNPPGTVVENCASFDGLSNSLTLQDACVSFTVADGEPKPCVLKEVCSPDDSYDPGDILRFRLRVQNIGSADITGATIQDMLHSNFNYVGNETYYSINDYNPPCSGGGGIPSGATPWTGVVPGHSGNNLSWSLPDIDSDCQLFYTGYCGYYGTWGLPYYYIEFDVMVDSMAMPGVTPNEYEISGGNLTSPVTSNIANVLVVASFGQEVEKQVSSDNGSNFASSATVNAGNNARFRLNYKNTSNVPVTSVRLADLLAMNDGNDDWLVLDRNTSRGSQFDLIYDNNHSTSLLPSGTAPSPTLGYAAGQNICLPDFGLNTGCNSVTWGSTADQNVKVDYGSFLLGSGVTVREDFDVTVPDTATVQDKACNDFAAVSTASFLLDGTPQSVALTPIAAPPVCITADPVVADNCCEQIKTDIVQDPDLGDCCARLVTECEVDSVIATIHNGTFSAANWNCGSLPSDYIGESSYTFDAAQCAVDMTTCVTPDSSGLVTIHYEIHFANGEVCEERVQMDCKAPDPECCENVKAEVVQASELGECCARLVTECEVDSVIATIHNGTFSAASWNCGTLPSDYIGESTYTFDAAQCAVDMTTCVTPDSTGVVTIHYEIHFANGEVCEERVEMDCKGPEPECCENVKAEVVQAPELGECCAQLVTECEVDSVIATIHNGTFSAANWNCGALPSDYIGESSYTFDAGQCAVDMTTCVTPDSTGVVTIHYEIYFANGEVCEERVEMDCKAPDSGCCDKVQTEIVQDPDLGECCTKLSTECETDSIMVLLGNGTFASAMLNGTSISGGFTGQSSYTFDTNSSPASLVHCITPDTTGVVTVDYMIYFSNGDVCERSMELDCAAPAASECCPVVDFNLRRRWPFWGTLSGTFEITNPDPSSPICSVEISSSPSGSFSTGNLIIDGSPSSQPWTSSSIPASGTLSPAAVNDMQFNLIATGYNGTVTICIVKCDGTRCCYEFNWNSKPVIDIGVELDQFNNDKLVAVSVSPMVDEPVEEKVKYVSFGYYNEEEVSDESGFFAISAGGGDCDDGDADRYPGASYMEKSSAFFELACPFDPAAAEGRPVFNLVLKGDLPELGCTMFSEEGNIIYSGQIDVAAPDSVISSIQDPGEISGKMFDLINLYPNPTTSSFRLVYATDTRRDVEIRIINPVGQTIKVIQPENDMPGLHNLDVDARGLAAGTYRVLLHSDGEVRSRAVVIGR